MIMGVDGNWKLVEQPAGIIRRLVGDLEPGRRTAKCPPGSSVGGHSRFLQAKSLPEALNLLRGQFVETITDRTDGCGQVSTSSEFFALVWGSGRVCRRCSGLSDFAATFRGASGLGCLTAEASAFGM